MDEIGNIVLDPLQWNIAVARGWKGLHRENHWVESPYDVWNKPFLVGNSPDEDPDKFVPEWTTDGNDALELCLEVYDALNARDNGWWTFEFGSEGVSFNKTVYGGGILDWIYVDGRNAKALAELAYKGMKELDPTIEDSVQSQRGTNGEQVSL